MIGAPDYSVGTSSRREVVLVAATTIIVLITGLVLPVWGASETANPEQDIFVSGLVLYAKLAANSPEAIEHGSYPELKSYDIHKGLAPERIDVVGVVNGQGVEVLVTLEVFPVVGVTNWRQTDGITDHQLLQNSKTVLASSLHLTQKVRLSGRTTVKYSDIDLHGLITRWRDRGYWPAEMIFKLTVEPIMGETALSNNIIEVKLPIYPPD
jgi:hypothetical protein